jgi:hypothetical protein
MEEGNQNVFGPIGANPFNVNGDGWLVHPPNMPAYQILYHRNVHRNPVRPAGMQPAPPPPPPQNQQRALDPFERLLNWRDGIQEERLEQLARAGTLQHVVETPNPPAFPNAFPNGHNYLRENYYPPYPYQHQPVPGGYHHHFHGDNHQNNNRYQDPGTVERELYGYPHQRAENLPNTFPLLPQTAAYAHNDVGFADANFQDPAVLDLAALRNTMVNPAVGFAATPRAVPPVPAWAFPHADFNALNLASRQVQPEITNAAFDFDDGFPLTYPQLG